MTDNERQTPAKDKVIRDEVLKVIEKSKELRLDGKESKAREILVQQIMILIKNRSSYLNIGRGMGAATGAVFGYMLSILIPGGSLATLIPGLLGTGYLGERVGKYTGEKLTEEEYCHVLKDLHYALIRPDYLVDKNNSCPHESNIDNEIDLINSKDLCDLIPFWKSLLILETPMDIFVADDKSGASFIGRFVRSVKRLIGSNLFALAVEAAKPESDNLKLLKKLTKLYLAGEIRNSDSRLVAKHLYSKDKSNKYTNRLLCSIYYIDMADFTTLKTEHEKLFNEHVSELFKADLRENPHNKQAIRNLAQSYLEENSTTKDTTSVFRKAVEQNINPKSRYALALAKSVDFDKEALLKEAQTVLELTQSGPNLIKKGKLTKDKLYLIEEIRISYLAKDRLFDNESIALSIEVFKRNQHFETNNLYLGEVWLKQEFNLDKLKTRENFLILLSKSLYLLRQRLSSNLQKKLIRQLQDLKFQHTENKEEADDKKATSEEKTLKLYGATMLIEHNDGENALKLLKEIRLDRGRGLSSWEKLESARLLAIANEMTGKFKRAWELFKGITLVETSKELLTSIFEFAVDLITKYERPTMARDAFTLIRSCDPDFIHISLGPIDKYYKEFQSVFDYYDEDSVKKVGGGGMAIVFSAIEKTTGHNHIIKQLRTDLGTPSEAKRFQRLFSSEIKAIRKLNESDHFGANHIVKLYYQSIDEESFCYSMERLDSILSDEIAETALPLERAVSIIKDIGKGLACAHAEGIVHRDLNPRNIGTKNGIVKIFDFGTAHILRTTIHLRRNVDSLSERDSENVIIGTPCYMSPEQAAGRQFDERSDIFSLGCVAFELITGELAFPGRLGSQVLTVGDSEKALADLKERLGNKNLPLKTIEAVIHTFAPYPEDRPDTVTEFTDLLTN